MSAVVKYELDGAIARVTLSRAGSRNAVNLQMCESLLQIFRDIELSDARVVVVSGDGPSFCAGADMNERRAKDEGWVRNRRLAGFAAYQAIERCSVPVIAAVHGAVFGSGGEISMAADFIIAARDTKFRFPEVHWGTVGATQRLQRIIGKRQAKELLFTNRILLADEAYQRGLVQRLYSNEELMAEVEQIAQLIVSAPAVSARLTKRAVDLGEETTLEHGIRIELAAIEQNLVQGSWRAGLEEFALERAETSEVSP